MDSDVKKNGGIVVGILNDLYYFVLIFGLTILGLFSVTIAEMRGMNVGWSG